MKAEGRRQRMQRREVEEGGGEGRAVGGEGRRG